MSMATPVPPDKGSVIERKLEYTEIAVLTSVVKISHFHNSTKVYDPMNTLLGPLSCSEGSLASERPIAP